MPDLFLFMPDVFLVMPDLFGHPINPKFTCDLKLQLKRLLAAS